MILVCASEGYFADDEHGSCADCGAPIVWRPHAPTEAVRLCLACVLKRMEAQQAKDGKPVTLTVTGKSLAEAVAWARRN